MRGRAGRLAARTGARGLIRAPRLIEASIDFADEDIPDDLRPQVLPRLSKGVRASMAGRELAGGAMQPSGIRDGFEVALVGAPNAGKIHAAERIWPGATWRLPPRWRAQRAT
jgi:tRNA modification GTPase